jgi:hypothetical protein
MASSGTTGPLDDNQSPVEHNMAPKPGTGHPGNVAQPLEPVASWDSEGTPSADYNISTNDDVRADCSSDHLANQLI